MLDREDLEVSSVVLEDTAPSTKQSTGLPSTGNNNSNAGPSSPVNISADPKFARLLQEAGT